MLEPLLGRGALSFIKGERAICIRDFRVSQEKPQAVLINNFVDTYALKMVIYVDMLILLQWNCHKVHSNLNPF